MLTETTEELLATTPIDTDSEIEADPFTLEPGLYDNIPFDKYLSIPAASASRLKALLKSPAHMRHDILNPKEETDALRLGKALHTSVLEPFRFIAEYAVMPDYANDPRNCTGKGEASTSAATSFYKNMAAKWQEDNWSRTQIDQAEYDTCLAIAARLRSHSDCNALLEADGVIEQTIVWRDKATGVLCKARADKRLFLDGRVSVVDLKSTRDARRRGFPRESWKYRYDIQAALYLDGLANFLQADAADFIFIAAEKNGVLGCGAFRMGDASIEVGRETNKRLLEIYAKCEAEQSWPLWSDEQSGISQYPDGIESMELPYHAFNEYGD